MKYYLSSYGIGRESTVLVRLIGKKKLLFIPNAMDHVEQQSREKSNRAGIAELTRLGIHVEILDLRAYFGKKDQLHELLRTVGGVWVRGGNTFVLRQAMKLSGFDQLIHAMNEDFLYAGYSAGICVLAPNLDALQIVDNPHVHAYGEITETVWEGLGLLDYIILPHYKSDHPESADIDKEVAFCQRQGIAYKTLRDGEVLLI